jgi:MYXO-CTERM domain-containing protein
MAGATSSGGTTTGGTGASSANGGESGEGGERASIGGEGGEGAARPPAPSVHSKSGCSCRVGADDEEPSHGWLGLVALALGLARRRVRGRSIGSTPSSPR